MPYTDLRRGQALLRANNMAKLFKKKIFDDIVDVITSPKPFTNAQKQTFNNACAAAQLSPEETAWLWNYLEHCDNALWGSAGVPDGATTGW